MKKHNDIELKVKGVTQSKSIPNAYALVLENEQTKARVPIIIGTLEAQSILVALQPYLKPQRPLTHDLFVNFINMSGFQLERICIHKLVDDVFYTHMYFFDGEEERILDSRASDAIAIALRYGAKIYVSEYVFEKTRIQIDHEESPKSEEKETVRVDEREPEDQDGDLPDDLESLKVCLEIALEEEDYQEAARIRDKIKRLGL